MLQQEFWQVHLMIVEEDWSIPQFRGKEIEAEISSGKYVDSLKEMFGCNSVNYFEVCRVVSSNCTAKVSLFIDFGADTSCDIIEVRKAIHPTIQICPNWFDLGNTEEHKTEDIEHCLLGRERVNTVAFKFMSNNVGRSHWHKASSASPTWEIY